MGCRPRRKFTDRYSRHVEKLPTRAFLSPLDVDEEVGGWVGGPVRWVLACVIYV